MSEAGEMGPGVHVCLWCEAQLYQASSGLHVR